MYDSSSGFAYLYLANIGTYANYTSIVVSLISSLSTRLGFKKLIKTKTDTNSGVRFFMRQ